MKKQIILIITIFIVLIMAVGCGSHVESINDNTKQTSMFVIVETANTWTVVYHKENKVMYAVSDSNYSRGVFTMLVNDDGTPLLYEEK